MFKKLVPISSDAHANKKVKALPNFDFAQNIHMAAVTVSEFPRAASSYPVVFVKGPNEDYKPVVLMGLKEGQNSYLSEDGRWDAPYVPAIIRRYPFGVATLTEKEGEFAICVDEESAALNEEEGQALFENGEATEYLNGVRDFLTDMQKQEFITGKFCELLVKHDLLISQNLELKTPEGETKRIGGFYLINEKKFRELPDQVFLEFRHKGALDAIYSQLASLAQVQRLVVQSAKAEA
ncbi:SapC family protein [Catenovulum sp. SM1970]|uniref:SapC family protein n=1 Tax=Marinifaba aquimaris TaxID=2741323 RepID=UPI0015744FBB|nr:SapC family protein [Marinifaba aquimaris]NTS75531.1 SapC family protein [Marinifaba aquimaris]